MELCKRLMQIIHARLEGVIAKEGRQVRKEDYDMEGKNSFQFIYKYYGYICINIRENYEI